MHGTFTLTLEQGERRFLNERLEGEIIKYRDRFVFPAMRAARASGKDTGEIDPRIMDRYSLMRRSLEQAELMLARELFGLSE